MSQQNQTINPVIPKIPVVPIVPIVSVNSTNTCENSYLIVPTTSSILINMAFVVILFIFYLIIIAYMSLYDSKNLPNLRMFIDFLMDNQTPISDLTDKVTQVVKNIPVNDITNCTGQLTPKIIKERFSNMSNNEISKPPILTIFSNGVFGITNKMQNFINTQLNSLILRTYIQGKTIKTTHKINL